MLPDEIPVLDDGQLDRNFLSVLPDVETISDVQEQQHLTSAWAKIFCITTLQRDKTEKRYFMKDFTGELPKPESFCKQLYKLHSHESPNGKFGFDCVTYNGNLPQDNTWFDSWEEFFANGLRHILRLREESAGPNPELDAVLPPLFETIIPRLLRPLESNGRQVKPSLVHGDLWCGNASVVKDTEEGMVYDPASFWAHNEYELGNWRPERNNFKKAYFEAYHSHIPESDPKEDYDDRNALYALRFNLHAATLFPDQDSYVLMAIDEIKRLTERLVGGT